MTVSLLLRNKIALFHLCLTLACEITSLLFRKHTCRVFDWQHFDCFAKRILRFSYLNRQPYIEVIQSYPCPLWINERKKPTMCSDDDVILHVPISTEFDPEEWLMKGVSMTSYLGED